MAQCLLRQAGPLATGRRPQLNMSIWRQQTADWRAVCGKTACTVRREGERSRALPTPIGGGSKMRPAAPSGKDIYSYSRRSEDVLAGWARGGIGRREGLRI